MVSALRQHCGKGQGEQAQSMLGDGIIRTWTLTGYAEG